jgi:molecular chaperone DnaJ
VRGADLEAELHLDFTDAVHGVTTSVGVTSDATCSRCGGNGAEPGTFPEQCPTCGGTGAVAVDQGPFSFSEVCPTCGGRGQVIEHRCKKCRGTGVERRRREVKVRIPAGVNDGQRIRVKGRGAAGRNGGPPGDLYVVVHVGRDAVFGRQGKKNLTVKVPVTYPEAALGAQVKVPTLDGPVTVKVAPGTASGKTLRVRGRGIQPATGDPGDLMVTLEVVVPSALTGEQRAAIEALAEKLPGNPREQMGV